MRGVAVTRVHRCEGGISDEGARGHGDRVFATSQLRGVQTHAIIQLENPRRPGWGVASETPERLGANTARPRSPMSCAPASSIHSSKDASGSAGAEWKCSALRRGQPRLRHGRAPDIQATRIKRHELQEHCGCRRLHISELSARRCCRALINGRAKRQHGVPTLGAFAFVRKICGMPNTPRSCCLARAWPM